MLFFLMLEHQRLITDLTLLANKSAAKSADTWNGNPQSFIDDLFQIRDELLAITSKGEIPNEELMHRARGVVNHATNIIPGAALDDQMRRNAAS